MPRILVSIQEIQYIYYVIFLRDNKQIGRTYKFNSDDKIYELLKRGRATLETRNIVENALVNRRPVMVDLELTEEQIRRI